MLIKLIPVNLMYLFIPLINYLQHSVEVMRNNRKQLL